MSTEIDKNGQNTFTALGEVLGLALPIIVAVGSATIMQFIDFWMVAQFGKDETAAVTPAGSLVFTITSFLIGLLSCNNTFVSQSHAKGRFADCARYTWQAVYLSVIGGIVAISLWPIAPRLFALIGHESELQHLEVVYFRIMLFSVMTCAAGMGLSGFFQGIGRPRIMMWVALVANGLNIFINWVLIFGNLGFPAMGVAGAGLGTSLAMCGQAVALLLAFLSSKYAKKYRTREVRGWDGVRAKDLFRIGWPAGVQYALDVACWGVFTALVVGRLGKVQLAASNIAAQMLHLSFMPTLGLSMATTALVGQQIGKGNLQAARARGGMAIRLGMAYMFSMGVLFLIFRKALMGFFRPDAEIIRLGAQILVLAAGFQLFDALCIVCGGALKGAGDTRFPAMVQIGLAWGVFLPASYVLAYVMDFKVAGAWGGACIFIIIFGVVLLFRWRSRAWEKINIFAGKPFRPAELPGQVPLSGPLEEVLEVPLSEEDNETEGNGEPTDAPAESEENE